MSNEGYKRKTDGCIIGIDFDGTIVTHTYPWVGKPLPFANEVIRMLNENGHRCFLHTMRDGSELLDAIKYCEENGLGMVGYNESPDQFSESPKQYAQLYIDDAAVGCPLLYDPKVSRRPFVDWFEVARYLESLGIITHEQMDDIRRLHNE